MLAVAVTAENSSQRLVLAEHAAPEPSADEAVVAVKAFSINNGEVRSALAGAEGYRPGWDLAGVIESAPEGSSLSVGDRVVGLTFEGGWAQQVAVTTSRLARIPDAVSFEAAAVLPVAGLTAKIALSKKALVPGDQILVTAATGGVGVLAIQLAAAAGAHVTAFVREPEDSAMLRPLGAQVVAVGIEDAERQGPYDLILEGVGGQLLGHALTWLRPRGVCVQFGDAAGDEATTFDAKAFRLGGGGAFGGTMLYGFFLIEELTRPDTADASALLTGLAQMLEAGTLDPMINMTGSWRDIDEVARLLLSRGFKGKAVLCVD